VTRISVCVPYWNRPTELARMFSEYERLYAGLEIEFSICDDGSPDPASVPEGVVLTRLPEKDHALNPCVPINRAVAASSGDVIVLTNPEMEHREPILPDMVALIEDDMDYVTAPCFDVDRGRWLAGESVRYDEHGRLPVPPGAHYHFLAVFTRKLWRRAGGFDEAYRHGAGADDADWVWRVWRAGGRFKLGKKPVYHYRLTRRSTWRGLPRNHAMFWERWPEALGV
jgi:hypothetical protein